MTRIETQHIPPAARLADAQMSAQRLRPRPL